MKWVVSAIYSERRQYNSTKLVQLILEWLILERHAFYKRSERND